MTLDGFLGVVPTSPDRLNSSLVRGVVSSFNPAVSYLRGGTDMQQINARGSFFPSPVIGSLSPLKYFDEGEKLATLIYTKMPRGGGADRTDSLREEETRQVLVTH